MAVNDVRAHMHAMWAGVANRWGEHADFLDARLEALTEAMLERAALRDADAVLELACGPGGTGLAAAARCPTSQVVLSDVAPEMVTIAAERATARGLGNVRTATLDLESIAEPDERYDVVLCREGLMFALDPPCAVREIHRVLRAGGRTAVSVWAAREDNPWLGAVFDALTAQIGTPVPPPGIPGPFALGNAEQLATLFREAGFAGVVVERVAVPVRAPSFDAWWARTEQVAGPVATIIGGLSADARHELTERVRAGLAEYIGAGGIEIPGLVLLTSARRV